MAAQQYRIACDECKFAYDWVCTAWDLVYDKMKEIRSFERTYGPRPAEEAADILAMLHGDLTAREAFCGSLELSLRAQQEQCAVCLAARKGVG